MSSPDGAKGIAPASADDPTAKLRWGIYALFIALAVGNMTGRLMAVNSVNNADLQKHLIRQDQQRAKQKLEQKNLTPEEFDRQLAVVNEKVLAQRQLQRPFLSANDRSRWLGIRALVEHGTYEIDEVLDRRLWNTIDMVQHRGRDGKLHLYSSKPPLLYTLLASEYWLLHKATGMTLTSHPYVLGRVMLMTINVLPMGLLFFVIARLAERFGKTDWGRIFVVASATLGTLLSPFAVVLNNHTVAAVSAALALLAVVKIWCDGSSQRRYYFAAGLFAAFTAANELPALAFLALLGLALLLCDRRAWLQSFLPAVLLVVVAFFATNYAAHNSLAPPYMHKGTESQEDDWYIYTYTIEGVERQSYWQNRQGIDLGEPSKWTYALHTTFGHHGIFSLTPVWMLSVLGLFLWCRHGDSRQRWLAIGIALLTVVCLVFYIALRPQVDRNYGGFCCGLRWMFWFIPLWLTAMLPAADWFSRTRTRQAVAATLLAISTFSASYPTWNPWTHPWLYTLLDHLR